LASDVSGGSSQSATQPQQTQQQAQKPVGGRAPAAGQYEDIQLTNMRKTIAKRLTESKSTIPHYYLTSEIVVNDLLK
jgi:pyruvate dehydrogenase E2 component (dihydrolipoamide acetyltransferase)